MPGIDHLRITFLVLVCSFGFATPVVRAEATSGPASTNAPGFSTQLRTEEIPGLPPMARAYVTLGTNRFAFLVPRGYRIESSPEKLKVISEDFGSFITIRVLPEGVRTGQADERERFRERVLQEHPGGRVVSEFTRTVDGHAGPAFDLHWTIGEGVVQSARVAFIPSPAGILEFSLVTDPSRFRRATFKFNNLLLTFRGSQNGHLDVTPLSNKL